MATTAASLRGDAPARLPEGGRGSRRARPWYLRARVLGWVLGGLAGAVILGLPAPEALEQGGIPALAATVAALVWWMADVGAGAASLVYTLVLLATGSSLPLALAGWREPAFWFFAAMLFYGVTMTSTGLDRRIAHALLSLVRPTYGGLLTALALIGFVLALLIPSLRVRMIILASITWSVTQAVGQPHRSRGALLLSVGTWIAGIGPGLAVPVVGLGALLVRDALAPSPLASLGWPQWLAFFLGPAALVTGIALAAFYLIMRPRRPPALSRTYFRHHQLRLGKPTWRERVALGVFLVSLAAWVTKEWHGVPESTVALAGVAVLLGTGALPLRQLAQWPLWSTLVFFATLFAIPALLAQTGFSGWAGGHLTPLVHVGAEGLVILGIILISARSSSSWVRVGATDHTSAAEPLFRRRGRVSLDLRSPHPTFIYVHEVPGGPAHTGGRRLWAARVSQSQLIAGKPHRRWRGRGWVRLTVETGASIGDRSPRGSQGGPWRRL